MATWLVRHEGRDVVLTFRDASGSTECGRGGAELLPEVLGWVIEQAQPYDRVQTEEAVFIRQSVSETAARLPA
jgi:hypothetical protein